MINETYKEMLGAKSVIRELSEYATARGKEIGYENVFDFSLGNPSVAVPQEFTDEMIRLLQTEDTMTLHGYTPSLGNPLYKEKIAQSLNKRFGMNYGPEHIFPTTGAAGAISHAIRAITKPGDKALAFAPFFPEYRPYITGAGVELEVVPADTETFQINFDKFEEMFTADVAAVLVNTPNNPSGVAYSTETLTRLAEILTAKSKEFGHTVYLLSDEPYREIVFEGTDSPYITKYYDNSISCYSYSKSLSIPGERLGYVAVNPKAKDAELIVPMCGQISRFTGHNCPPSIIMQAVAAVIDETSDLSVYETNAKLLYDALTEMGYSCVKPGGTFYMFPQSPIPDANEFCWKAARELGLIIVPGDSFECPGHFRISYCVQTETIEKAIPLFRKALEIV